MSWIAYLEQNQSRFIDELLEFISIPSVSSSDEHFQDVMMVMVILIIGFIGIRMRIREGMRT